MIIYNIIEQWDDDEIIVNIVGCYENLDKAKEVLHNIANSIKHDYFNHEEDEYDEPTDRWITMTDGDCQYYNLWIQECILNKCSYDEC